MQGKSGLSAFPQQLHTVAVLSSKATLLHINSLRDFEAQRKMTISHYHIYS